MKGDKEFRKNYKELFAEIHVSEELASKVQDMSKSDVEQAIRVKSDKKHKTIFCWRQLVAATVAFLLLIVGSNGMVYAVTGTTWLKTLVVCLNGTEYSVDVNVEEEDNYFVTQGWLMGDEGPTAITIINDKDDPQVADNIVLYVIMAKPEIVEQEGNIYFKEGDVEIDITEDAADGQASGIYQIEGVTKCYNAEYGDGGWNVSTSEHPNE